MVVLLLLLLVTAVIQLALALHVRNTVIDAAAEGARYAALYGATPGEGVERTKALIRGALSDSFAADVTASSVNQVTEVRVRATLPLIGLFGFPAALDVSGHATEERVD